MVRIPDSTTLMGRDINMRSAGNPVTGIDNDMGAGLAKLGQGVSRGAEAIQAYVQEKERDQDTLDLTKAQAHYNTRMAELDKRFSYENDQDYGTWGKRYREEAAKVREEASGIITSQQRRALFGAKIDGDIGTRALSVEERSKGVARNLGRTQLEQSLDQQVSAATDPASDPARGERIMAETKASIDSAVRTGMMTPAEGEAAWARVKQRRAGIQADRDLQADPEKVRSGLGAGVTPTVVDRIIGVESGGNPTARNPNSTATGAGQFIEGTWMQFIRERYPDMAGNRGEALALRNDPKLSREAVEWYARKNASVLRGNGIQDTPGNIYLAHFAGPQGAVKINKADPNAPIESVLDADAIAANRKLLGGKTVAWVKEWANNKMAGVASPPGGYYADLSTEQRERLLSRSESLLAQRETEMRAQSRLLSDRIVDDYNSIRSTGMGIEGLDRSAVDRLLGPTEGDRFERERKNARTFFEATKDFDALPNNQIVARIEATRPQGGMEGFTEAQANHEEIAKKGAEVIAKRNADPAAAVETSETVRKAREEARYVGEGDGRRIEPESAQRIVRTRLAAQEALGIDRPYAVTRSEARILGRQLRAIGDDQPDQLNAFMNGLRQTYGVHADSVLASTLELEGVNRELSNLATKILGAIALGRMPDISSLRQMDAMIEWGTNNAPPAPANSNAAGGMYDGTNPPVDPYLGTAMGAPARAPAPRANGEATFDQADVLFLIKNANNPDVIREFDSPQKYGPGASKKILDAYKARIEAERRK